MAADPARLDGSVVEPADDPYRVVSEHLPDVAVLVFDRELRFRLLTGAALRDGAWRQDELVGRTVLEVFPPAQGEALAGRYRAALAGERQRFEVSGWRDPSRFWSVDIVPIYSSSGTITGGMAFCRDITERHRSEEALRDSRRQLAEAQRVARVGSWEWEPTTGRLTWSDEMYRLVGADREKELTVEDALAFVHPDDRARVAEAMERIVHDPTPLRFEMRTIRQDGTVRTLLARGEGICDEFGRVVRVIGTDQDVTEAKQAEQERRRLLGRLYEVLEGQHQRLAADLHDEHVQSLTAITLKLDQARLRFDRDEPGAGRGLLAELREDLSEETDALRRTIAALRPLVLDQRGLEAAVRELTTAACARAGIKTCQVTVDLEGAPLAPAAETVLFRVIQQALSNVEQHAAASAVRVGLGREGATAVLQVEDDGRGFDLTHIETVAGSQGFGLTSMRERVQAIGGEFMVVSRAGAGTRVEARVGAEAEP